MYYQRRDMPSNSTDGDVLWCLACTRAAAVLYQAMMMRTA